MPVGTLSGGVCFATQAAAARNECSLNSKVNSVAMTCYSVSAGPSETVGGAVVAVMNQRWQRPAVATYDTVAYSVALQSCETSDYWPWPMSVEDGGAIAVAVAAVWLVATAWRSARRSTD